MVEVVLAFMFMCSLAIAINERQHVIIMILSLELMVVRLFCMLVLNGGGGGMFCLIFLTFGVCEAVLGLRVLVGLVRGFGRAKVSGLFLLKF